METSELMTLMSLATAAKENRLAASPTDARASPSARRLFSTPDLVGEHRLGPALLQCTETSCVVGSIGAGGGEPEACWRLTVTVALPSSLSQMILYFYLGVCGFFFNCLQIRKEP